MKKRGPKAEEGPETVDDFSRVAAELIRALRGKRSQVAFSRRLGYASSVVHRWEAEKSWPTASRFLAGCERLGIDVSACFVRFFQLEPDWLRVHRPTTPAGVAAFLKQLRGKTPVIRLAEATRVNRFTVSRWFNGKAEPSLPELLSLVEASSRRMCDFIALLVDPAALPSLARRWQQLERTRRVAYEFPLSHAVLRALELPQPSGDQTAWLMETLGMTRDQVTQALALLEGTGQIAKRRGVWRLERVLAVNTGHDPRRAHVARMAWARVAVERMERQGPGHYGYSLFAIGKSDLLELRALHLDYVRAMQAIIANSARSECVALFCSQLFDLNLGEGNALRAGSKMGA